ncbi:DEAD/DEAH box helicase [Corynebacterium hansenii]|uniref:DEAD/DEAH box helicase n=1 Tax=Corynebacterium hansenii TaxID=394964 RepID=A0ABV7ZU70_9CORY|nr:DEAD/DEAH box helicase [Corynebacterium hansenii]WJZ00095.1 ATP-dependent RNA helicase RhlE [Corynebacterium hansenii]
MRVTEPTPIQAAVLPDALAGRDILGRAPTGSGKTLAFGIPLVQALAGSASRPGRPRGLVIAPTRELADQIADVLGDLGAAAGLRVRAFVGGENIARQKLTLAAPVDIAVVTPGRAHDLRRKGWLSLDDVAVAVIDEADELAALGFLPDVLGLLRATPAGAVRMLFSATLDAAAEALMEGRSPARHEVSEAVVSVETMKHLVFRVPDNDAADAVTAWIAAREGRVVLFGNTRHRVTGLAEFLAGQGIRAEALHGDRGQTARRKALADFASGEIPVLVATDVAARGIDVDSLDLVVHVDPPPEAATYVHRSGRTARAGATGTVVTIVRDRQADAVADMLRAAGVDPEIIDVSPGSKALKKWTGARKPPGPARGRSGSGAGREARGSGQGAGRRQAGTGRGKPGRGPARASRPHRPKRKRGKK